MNDLVLITEIRDFDHSIVIAPISGGSRDSRVHTLTPAVFSPAQR